MMEKIRKTISCISEVTKADSDTFPASSNDIKKKIVELPYV